MRRYWTCRKCSHRNERTASRSCQGCGSKSKPATRKPAHMAGLQAEADPFCSTECARAFHRNPIPVKSIWAKVE